jgi:hypothetical protein
VNRVLLLLLVPVAALVAMNIPDLRRYLRIKAM